MAATETLGMGLLRPLSKSALLRCAPQAGSPLTVPYSPRR